MNMFNALLISAPIAIFSGVSQAVTIDFQDLPSGECAGVGTVAESRGFTFTGNPADPGLLVCDPGILQSNPTAALLNATSRSILTMTDSHGDTFSVESFFAGGRTSERNPAGAVGEVDPATGIDIVGYLVGGGTVSTTVTLDDVAPYAWEQFVLPDSFSNLTSVVFTAQGRNSPEFLIDDIVVNEPNHSIPEPGSLALLSLGLAAITLIRRRAKC